MPDFYSSSLATPLLSLRRSGLSIVVLLLLASVVATFSPTVIAQDVTEVEIGNGTLDSEKQAGPRWLRLDFDSLAAAVHTVTVSWNSDADVRFKVREENGDAVSSTVRGTSPGVWQGELEANSEYYIALWSVDGVANYTATVETSADLAITTQPADLTVFEGESAAFTVDATGGNGTLRYRWLADGTPISGSGAARSTLNLGEVDVGDSGTLFSVRITDDNDLVVVSESAALEVLPVSAHIIGMGTVDSTRETAPRWVRLDFDSLAAAEHTITVSWSNDADADVRFKVRERSGSAVSSTVRGTNPGEWVGELEADSEYYTALWSDDGVASYIATAEAYVEPVDRVDLYITAQPTDLTVSAGENATFTVEASGGTGTFDYQWFADGVVIPDATGRTLNITAANLGDSGTDYSVEITDDDNNVVESDSARLTVVATAPADDNVLARWTMNEPAGASIITDSSGNGRHGTIGADVVTGDEERGATAYRWLFTPPTEAYEPGRIVNVPHYSALNPGTDDYSITMRYRTNVSFGNIVQKGQGGSSGGYWKIENPGGNLTCVFRGLNNSGGWNRKEVVSSRPLNDGEYHTITCERVGTTLRLFVDGVLDDTASNSFGSISNNQPISIGGKTNCDNQNISCDYFTGWIDEISISAP